MRKFKKIEDVPSELSDNPRMFNGSNPVYKHIVFDDEQEMEAYMSSTYNNWSKELHIARINQLHDNEFERLLSSRNYLSMSELSLWAQSADSEYYDEANALLSWYTSTYLLMEQYFSSVTEESALTPEAFINTLPVFSFS